MKWQKTIATAAAAAMLIGLAACGSGDTADDAAHSSAQPITAEDIAAVLDSDDQVDLTLWGWAVNQYTPAIEAFQKRYPQISINFVVQSGSTDMYTKYQNAVEAGSGVPDVMQWEYFAIPQYAVSGSLLNFADDSIESGLGGLYNASAWNDVHVADGLYGIPTDQGPTVMFYRQDILDQYGLEVPTTWAQLEEEGKALHAADPTKYLAYLPVDTTAEAFLNMLRFADTAPWSVDGLTDVTLDMTNDKVREVADYMRRAIDEGVFKVVSNSSDEYTRMIADGDVALGIHGAWRSGGIENDFPEQAGLWRVALPPVWGDGEQTHNSVSGGSAFTVSASSSREKQVAAVAFANWISSAPESVDILVDQGLLSAATSYQDDPAAAAVTSDYFGGQAVNQVFFDAAKAVDADWPTLPFMQEVHTTYLDTVLPTLSDGSDIFAAIGQWQDQIASWATDQGFDVTVAKD